jgi:ferredoxin
MAPIKVWIDTTRCLATQGCIQTAPEAFQLGPDNRSQVVDQKAVTEETLWDAAQLCPTSAIIIEDAETGERLFP